MEIHERAIWGGSRRAGRHWMLIDSGCAWRGVTDTRRVVMAVLVRVRLRVKQWVPESGPARRASFRERASFE